MSDSLNTDLHPLLEAPEPFATALYLGPGLESLAAALSGTQAERLVAFTLPGAAKALLKQTITAPAQVEPHSALLSIGGDTAQLQDFNIKGYAALRPATGLKQIFPGLRETSQTSIDTVSPAEALAEAKLEGTNNLLILGASGFEMDVLNAFLPDGSLAPFSRIILLLPETVLYQGASTSAALVARMDQAGYRRGWTDSSDPDMPIAAFDLDHALFETRATLAERDRNIAALTDRLDRLTNDLKEVQAQRDAMQHRLAETEAARDTACTETESVRQELAQAQAAAKDFQQQASELKTAEAKAQAIAAAERKACATITTEKDAAQQKVDELESALGTAHAETESVRQEMAEAWAKCRELEEWVETLKAQHDTALTKAAENASSFQRAKANAEDDLTLALRQQGLREADLAELKGRYRALMTEKDQLTDLLRTTLHNLRFLKDRKQDGKETAKRA